MAVKKSVQNEIRRSAVIQYLGVPGSSYDCRDAIIQILQHGDKVTRAQILTYDRNHAFRLTINDLDQVIIKSGFASGYRGTGPNVFSYVLQLLEAHGAKIDEYLVSEEFLERVEHSCLRESDIRRLDRKRPVRPSRWKDYVYDRDWSRRKLKQLWDEFPLAIPFRIIDPRIMDIALGFWEAPSDRLLTAFRRLEDIVRERTGASEKSGKLFAQAFLGPQRLLEWPNCDEGESASRGELFRVTFSAFRNPHAHGEADRSVEELLSEFLIVNQLYRLEDAAVVRTPDPSPDTKDNQGQITVSTNIRNN